MRKTDFGRQPIRKFLLALLLAGTFVLSNAQNVGEYHHDVTTKEWNFQLFAHTAGFGVGFQHGRTPDLYNKHFWEVQLMSNKHPKSIRSINAIYENVRPIRYGQLYSLFFLQGGYGYQRTIHLKPYWGGVQVNYTLSAGPALGIGIPNYVEVLNYNTGFSEIVRYNPDKHNLNNILGGAQMFTGIMETIVRPGFYAKTGLNFDFSKNDYKLLSLEVGVQIQMVFPFIQQMAFNPAKKFYLTGYLAFNFGKKVGIHGKS
ncbi:MAG: hypothetical protein IKO75_14240 [Bacteroidales bacterium]|jgi:hypothetical protein|nr:hypothetical protein [Bacteroidales bacterium]